jgi:eukaryotic-like serine/threonine-protein kinase
MTHATMGIAMIGTASEFRYWAFISYSSRDGSFARWLHEAIESYSIPGKLIGQSTPARRLAPKRFKPCFLDRFELPASSDLGARIEAALRQSSYLIVVCSPGAANSQWVNKEVETFQELGRGGRILPVIVSGDPHGSRETQCFPPSLLRTEPIAADARPGADGKKNAKLQLVAGMLGVNLDDLKQRDRKLRVRQVWTATSAATLLLLLLGGFAGVAWWHRRAAEHQREIARERSGSLRRILSGITWTLDEQIDDMPGSLKVRADSLDGVDDYLLKLSDDSPSDVGLLRDAAVARSKLARVKISMGRLSEARFSLEGAISLDRKLVGQDSNNGLYQLDLASDLEEYAFLHLMQGNPRAASRLIAEATTILQHLVAVIPVHEQVQYCLASVHLLSGLLAWDQGAEDEAASEFGKSSDLFESLVRKSPKIVTYLSNLAELNTYRARMFRFAGAMELADRYCLKNAEVLKRLNEGATSHSSAARAIAAGIYEIAETLLARGLVNEAETDAKSGILFIQDACKIDPQDASAQLILAQGQILLARILSTRGSTAHSAEMFLGAHAIGEQLATIDPSNLEGWATQAIADGERAIAYKRNGDTVNSTRYARTFRAEVKAIQVSGKVLTPPLRRVLTEAEEEGLQ